MNKALAFLFILLSVPAFASEYGEPPVESRSWYDLEMLGVVASLTWNSGQYHKAGKIGCSTPGNCLPYSVSAISTDLFTAFPFLNEGTRGVNFGPWIGQDFGYGNMDGDGFIFGTTYLGGVLYFNIVDMLQWYFAAGYGISYADISSERFTMDGTNTGFASMTGVSVMPFRKTWLAPLGFNFNIKFMDLLPTIYGNTPDVSGKYNLMLSSSFGIFIKF